MKSLEINSTTLLLKWVKLKTYELFEKHIQDKMIIDIEKYLLQAEISNIDFVNISKDYYTVTFKFLNIPRVKQFTYEQVKDQDIL